MKTKTFDCVEMKRHGASGICGEIRDMTIEQQIKYWEQQFEEFNKWWKERTRSPSGSK